jgi:predicted HicB family RNase H-like nuclease
MGKTRGGDGGKALRETIRQNPSISCRVPDQTKLALAMIAYREKVSLAHITSRAIDGFLSSYLNQSETRLDVITRKQQPQKARDAEIPFERRVQICFRLPKEQNDALTKQASQRGVSRSAHIARLLATHPDNK